MSVYAAIECLLCCRSKEDIRPSKDLIARLTREWNIFKTTIESIGFDPVEHRVGYIDPTQGDEWAYCAHDWIMSRNYTGNGFLDGNWDKEYAEQLHNIALSIGQLDIEEYRGRIYPYSIVYINKFATYCLVKYQESSSRFTYNKENPSSFMMKLPEVDNMWRRVYTMSYGNSSSDWVYIKGERVCLGNLLIGENIYMNNEAVRLEIY